MKKATRNHLALLLAAALSLGTLAGCGAVPDEPAPQETSPAIQTETAPTPQTANESENGENENDLLRALEYDPEEMPNGPKSVIFLQGTWYEMGYQYGTQVPDVVKREAAIGLAKKINKYGYDVASAEADYYIAHYETHMPELLDLYHGMADAVGLDYHDFVTGILYFSGVMNTDTEDSDAEKTGCSNIAAWGSQTVDGELIVGANLDLYDEYHYYVPSVVAYPDDGNAFVTSSGFFCNMVLNEKGLVITGSSGQSAGEGDRAIGMSPTVGCSVLAARCDTAEEAADEYIKDGRLCFGDNFHGEDINGGHVIVESSPAHYAKRHPGDFGEKDYLIATNDFMTEEMQSSLLPAGSGYDDCRPRYWTEERVLLDANGKATAETIAKAIGSNRYYADGKWVDDNWNYEYGLFCPEAISPSFQTITQSIVVASKAALYVRNGCGNTLVSFNPNATGNFVKLVLADTMESTCSSLRNTAAALIFEAGGVIYHSGDEDTSAMEASLRLAKEAIVKGDNYKAFAACASDEDTARLYYGKACSSFLEAQDYAQTAAGDTFAVLRY